MKLGASHKSPLNCYDYQRRQVMLMPEPQDNQLAILIDYQNIAISFARKYGDEDRINWTRVLETALKYGRVLMRRAYADWSENRSAQWELLRLGFELVNVPAKRGMKNAADIKMVIDALDAFIISRSPVTHVLLMSGDSDFTDFVHYLRARGIYVYGMGIEGSIAEYLIRACDKYDYYDRLHAAVAPAADSSRQSNPVRADVSEARRILRQCLDALGIVEIDGGSLKAQILRLQPDFDESSYGYERFRNFLEAQSDMVEVETHPTGGHLVIRRAKNGAATPPANTHEVVVDKYLAILRKMSINVTPSEYRPLILREAFSLFRENGMNSFLDTRDRLCALFDKKHPQVLIGYVLDTIYQIPQASCLDWELSRGQYAVDTPLWSRKAKLKKSIRTLADLLVKVDSHIVSVITSGVSPDSVDIEAASRVLYGRKPDPTLSAYIEGLLGRNPPVPPPTALFEGLPDA